MIMLMTEAEFRAAKMDVVEREFIVPRRAQLRAMCFPTMDYGVIQARPDNVLVVDGRAEVVRLEAEQK